MTENEIPLSNTDLNKGVQKRLKEIGVETLEDLRKVTPEKAYVEMKKKLGGGVLPMCYNLYDPAAILKGVPMGWKGLDESEKKGLKSKVEKLLK
jgi:hypothetical protein